MHRDTPTRLVAAQALWSVVIGLQTSLASLVVGHHTALAVHRSASLQLQHAVRFKR